MKNLSAFFFIVSLLLPCCCSAQKDDESFEGHDSLEMILEHSLDEGRSFSRRGSFSFDPAKDRAGEVQQTQIHANQLRKLCDERKLYLLKMTSGVTAHKTAADPCSLVRSGLRDVITLHMDWKSQIVGFSVVTPGAAAAAAAALPESTGDSLVTTVTLQQMEAGPQPDTAAFIQRMEQEKLAQQRGETKDNRSFFGKYWMYIIPVVLVLAMSSANPEQQGAAR